MKNVFFIILFICFAYADDIDLNANVVSLKLYQDNLYIGLDNGKVEKYNFDLKEISNLTDFDEVSNFIGEKTLPKIFSIDIFDDKMALIAEADKGKRDIAILSINGDPIKKTILPSPIDSLKYAYIYDKDTLLLINLGGEICYYDIADKKIVYRKQLTTSLTTSSFYDKASKQLFIACEGGLVFVFDTNTKELKETMELHKDSIYSIDYAKNELVTGSADKNVNLLNLKTKKTIKIDTNFLVYCVGINDKFIAYSLQDKVIVLDKNKDKYKEFLYNGFILDNLIFYKDMLIGSGFEHKIHIWSLK